MRLTYFQFLNHICLFIYLVGDRHNWDCAVALQCSSEDNVGESAFSSHHVGPGYRTQVVRLGSKRLYLQSHLMHSPKISLFC